MHSDWVTLLDGVGCADELAASRARIVEAELTQVRLVEHWCDLHSGPVDHVRPALPGAERAFALGAGGTPPVREFAAGELGLLLGLTTTSARSLMRDVLDLRHRHPRLHRVLRTIITRMHVTLGCFLLTAIAAAPAAAEPSPENRIEVGPCSNSCGAPFRLSTAHGSAPVRHLIFRWPGRALHLRTKALLVIGRTSHRKAAIREQVDESAMLVGGALVRVLASIDIGPMFVLRAGPVGAALVGNYSSSVCGDESYKTIAPGRSFEVGVRFGRDSQFELAGQMDGIFIRPPRCKTQYASGLPPRNESERNVGLFVGGAIT